MINANTIKILKDVILLERKEKAFYSHIANQATDVDIKTFFQNMANEENEHLKYLTKQYRHLIQNENFLEVKIDISNNETSDKILSENIKNKISSASFEAAAISSAIDMKNRAIAIYSERAENSESIEEQNFYKLLADWEKGHHKLLHYIDNELKERIWNDNNFFAF